MCPIGSASAASPFAPLACLPKCALVSLLYVHCVWTWFFFVCSSMKQCTIHLRYSLDFVAWQYYAEKRRLSSSSAGDDAGDPSIVEMLVRHGLTKRTPMMTSTWILCFRNFCLVYLSPFLLKNISMQEYSSMITRSAMRMKDW